MCDCACVRHRPYSWLASLQRGMPSYPLHEAARDGDAAGVARCIAEGIGVNTKNKRGNTPLMQAAEKVRRDVVQLLLDAKADPTICNPRKLTAREIAERHAGGRRAADASVSSMLAAAEALHAEQAASEAATGQCSSPSAGNERVALQCPVCGEEVRARQKVDFITDVGD
eukprot:COSAG01_NODE_18930_length_1043_cov_0.675847_1_plen_169_part_10